MTARPVRIRVEPLDVSLAHRRADEALAIARGVVVSGPDEDRRLHVWLPEVRRGVVAWLAFLGAIAVMAGAWFALDWLEAWWR